MFPRNAITRNIYENPYYKTYVIILMYIHRYIHGYTYSREIFKTALSKGRGGKMKNVSHGNTTVNDGCTLKHYYREAVTI